MSGKKVVIVTGGSKGIGLGIVKDLLSQGYRVATCSRTPTAEMTELAGEDFLYVSAEIGDEASEEAFVNEVQKWAGKDGIYGLVNNAGIAREGILATFPNVESEKLIQVNLLGALRMARLALRTMLSRPDGGRIINISSIVGLRGYNGLSAYSASKAGMDGFTRGLAREVGRRKITVNSVAPGYVRTDISASLQDRQRQQIVNRTPLGRLAEVEDIVPVVTFMLSDGAAFITGQTIVVDGGITN
jgi:3-oxoacyl-[acyl-carrier protein] reductase